MEVLLSLHNSQRGQLITRICSRGFHPGNGGARRSGYAAFVAALPQVYIKCADTEVQNYRKRKS